MTKTVEELETDLVDVVLNATGLLPESIYDARQALLDALLAARKPKSRTEYLFVNILEDGEVRTAWGTADDLMQDYGWRMTDISREVSK